MHRQTTAEIRHDRPGQAAQTRSNLFLPYSSYASVRLCGKIFPLQTAKSLSIACNLCYTVAQSQSGDVLIFDNKNLKSASGPNQPGQPVFQGTLHVVVANKELTLISSFVCKKAEHGAFRRAKPLCINKFGVPTEAGTPLEHVWNVSVKARS